MKTITKLYRWSIYWIKLAWWNLRMARIEAELIIVRALLRRAKRAELRAAQRRLTT